MPWWGWLIVALCAWLLAFATVVAVWVFRTAREVRHGIRRGTHRPADRRPIF